jgi:hypothetical protein
VCFYHAGCPDGFGAAWAVWKAWGDAADYRPRGHTDALRAEEFAGAEVAFVDLAVPNEALRALAEQAARIVLLDHHVSARERYRADRGLDDLIRSRGHLVRFDLEHSGAVLAWSHFHPDEPLPPLLEYLEDMDLWRWKLPRSEEVNAAVNSHPRRFEVWDELAATEVERLAAEGAPILRARRAEVERALAMAHPIRLGSRRVEAVNAVAHRAWIGHELAERAAYGLPCGVVYRLAGRYVDASIYSIGELDVTRIAAEYGGGGHRNAAGFQVSLEDWLARFV